MAGKVETHLGSTNGISTNSLHDVSLLEPIETPSGQTHSAGSNSSSPPQTSTNSSSAPPLSGITMLIVGAGFAGLACAIEGVRKGHDVLVLERWAGPGAGENNQLGDVLSLGPNAGRIVERWGLHERLWPICGHAASLKIHDLPGTLLHTQPLPVTEFGAHAYNGRRGEMHTVLLEHALQLGVKVRWGVEVGSYWESGAATHDETRCEGQKTDGPGSDAGVPLQTQSGRAGVVLTSNERLEADVVVAADGVWSAARGYVLGYLDRPKSSGYAIYRAWFNAQDHGIDKDPLTDFMCKGEDVVYAWIGPDVHFITSCSQNGTAVSCVLTHRDTSDIPESYSLPGSKPDILRIVRDWDPRCAAVLSKAPHFVDWKLVYRDPLPTWISKGGRVLLVGDAAHPFLPTSIQGASQAIEDGVALAVTLQLAGKRKVPLAVKAWEHIRYERVRLAQLMGESTRDKWHTAAPRKQGADIYLPRPEWLFAFDVEKDAYEVYAQVSQKIEEWGYTMPVLPL